MAPDQTPKHDPQRATRSGAVGYSADTDDWLAVIEHEEQRIDPNREVAPNERRNGPMPMPPMMGMGAPGAGVSGSTAGLAGVGNPAGLAGRLGATGSVSGSGGTAGLGTVAAGGAGQGIDTDGDGIIDTYPLGGVDTDGDGVPDLFPGDPGYPGSGDDAYPSDGGYGSGGTSPSGGPDLPGSSGSDTWPGPGSSGSSPIDDVMPSGDITVDPSDIDAAAGGWQEVSAELTQLNQLAQLHSQPSDKMFGVITPPTTSYVALQNTILTWTSNAQKEFNSIGSKLSGNATSYRSLSDQQVASTSTIQED